METQISQTQQIYNLNLSSDYLPNWGGWEVAREIISNAIDADPNLKITYPSPDVLEVITSTVPSLSEMFIIGQGTKSANGETIGQFGEGSKMAALVATRCGAMELFLPEQRVSFAFEEQESMGVKTLHAKVIPSANPNEFRVKITYPGISIIAKNRILFNVVEGPIKKASNKGAQIYCKGIFISEITSEESKYPFLYDWNLNKLTLNRDRNMVNANSISGAISTWLCSNLTLEIAEELIRKDTCIESSALYYADGSDHVRGLMYQAWTNVHGDSLLSTGEETTKIARREGRKVVEIQNNYYFLNALIRCKIPLDSSVVTHKNRFLRATNQQEKAIAQLRKLDALIGAPTLNEVIVYQTTKETHFGSADSANLIIYLSEDLFAPGNQFNLIRTYLHEMAHIMSNGANDETGEFESALDNLLGKLGTFALQNL